MSATFGWAYTNSLAPELRGPASALSLFLRASVRHTAVDDADARWRAAAGGAPIPWAQPTSQELANVERRVEIAGRLPVDQNDNRRESLDHLPPPHAQYGPQLENDRRIAS